MKNKIPLLVVKYALIIFFGITFLLFGSNPNISEQKIIILNVAIDKDAVGYELSCQYLIPEYGTSYSEKTDVISEKAQSIGLAIEKIEAKTGKSLGLAHTSAIVFSDEVLEESIFETLDYFVRERSLGNNAIMIGTPKKAKDLLVTASSPQSSNINSLVNIATHESTINWGGESSINSFMQNYFSKSQTSYMSRLEIQEEKAEKSTTSSGASGGQSSGGSNAQSGGQSGTSSSEQQMKSIGNKGDISVFKNGKKITVLDYEQSKGFNWYLSKTKKTTMHLEHISDENFDDATVELNLYRQYFNKETSFANNKPIMKFSVGVQCEIVSIFDENNQIEFYKNNKNFVSETLKKAIKDEIIKQLQTSINISQEKNFDLFGVYNNFYKYCKNDWSKYINSLPDSEYYIQGVTFFADTNVEPK